VQSNSSDKGEFHGQVDALVFAALDARRQRCAMAGGNGDASVMELEAAGEGSDDRLVLEQRQPHADADSGAFGKREEAAPAAGHLVWRREATLARSAVLGFGGIAAADEPASRAEDVRVAEDVLIAVDTDRGNVDDLALLDGDRLDPRIVSAANGVAEGDDIVRFGDLFIPGGRGEHAHDLFAHGIEVGKAAGVGKVVVGGLASDRAKFLAELGLDIRVLGEGPKCESNGGGSGLMAGNTMNFLFKKFGK